MRTADVSRKYPDGRDEMNLADFPISVLQRQQKSDAAGNKLDQITFEATRYDAVAHQRARQRVTLTSTARDGLPTPADEHVILALLYVAKHGNDFAEPTVHFAPAQLFDVMGWAPNGRSYARLRDVLRRLKALTVRYENAWWDVVGRGYEEEVATGIISAYRIARQVSGPRTERTPLESWVTWTQQFHESLKNGNLKRLDLDVFFALRTPTAQRLYRFLDKRFYNSPVVSMDLVELACGHVGLTDAGNVALLKRRLAPALAELEGIGFLSPAGPAERYQKVKAGAWRIHLRSAKAAVVPLAAEGAPALPATPRPVPALPADGPAAELAREFYRLWSPAQPAQPGPRDLEHAEALLKAHGAEAARELVALLVQVTRRGWPECRSLSGAAQKYLADAVRLREQHLAREAARQAAAEARRQEKEARRQRDERPLLERWQALAAEERAAIEETVRGRLGASAPEAFVQRLCLEELGRSGG